MRVLILLIVASAGCVAPSPAPTPSAAAAAATAGDSVAGTLRVVGSAPVNVRLVIQGAGGSSNVGGALTGELRRLAGAEVTLLGRRQGADFVPTDYRVRAIDGRPVTLGTVEGRDGDYLRLRTMSGELVYLVASPGEIRSGQKIWVQGPQGVIVQSFGTVRP
ncbi:MAG: hypothetical protein KY464_07045 [Gemmatimonadetes bacterium]|nr:hypothetical protein [Gemmatimonadota bacterium]